MKKVPILLLLPTLALMSLTAFIPLMTVLNYSLHVLFPGSTAYYVGLENYVEVLHDPLFGGALLRQLIFSFLILAIEIPLGLLISLAMPKTGRWVGPVFILLVFPLLIPYNVIGIMWRVFTRFDLGVVPAFFKILGYEYNVSLHWGDAWWTVIVMDVWHWSPLVALLCYAGLQAIPKEFYQAAQIDRASAWATFRYITLPKLKYVLIIAVLLRFMDSFKIYAEPFQLTGGGPGSATTYLSTYTTRKAIGGFEMGFGAAVSLIYFFIVVVLSYILYTIMVHVGRREGR